MMTEHPVTPTVPAAALPHRRPAVLRKRFLALSVASLAVLGAVMGVGFTGNTGTSTVSVSASGGSTNYVVTQNSTLPSATGDTVNAVPYSVSPSWSPVANTAGSVTTPGGLALVDTSGTTNGVIVNVFITNLQNMQSDYSSFALPVNIWSSPCTNGTCTWTEQPTYDSFITNTQGQVSFNLPKGSGPFFDIVMDTDGVSGGDKSSGSYYCTSTTASSGALSPNFYFTAEPY